MEWFLILGIIAAILLLGIIIGKFGKNEQEKSINEKEPDVFPLNEVSETGTVINLQGLEKYGYGELSYNAPINNPYSFFFFIVKYRTLNNTIRYSIAVSRGFEEPRIIKYCTYDELEDLTIEKIEKFTNKFDMFVDDVQFNNLVCNYRKDNIIEIIKKL